MSKSDILETHDPRRGRFREAYKSYTVAKSHYDKTPQAVVKVTSYLNGVNKAVDHHLYISRNGHISLETEDGELINGAEEIKDLLEEWRVDFDKTKAPVLEGYTITIVNDDPEKLSNILEIAKEYSSNTLNGLDWRVDKGRGSTNTNHVSISVKQPHESSSLPVIEAIQESVDLAFAGYQTKVSNTKVQRNRDVANIMMSAPLGSDSEAVRTAVRNTVKEAFGDKGYRYVFTLHDPATDEKTKNPHVHISIKMVNEITGKKLRINPKDLVSLRELFAEKAREQGIHMAVSMRYERGLAKAGSKTINEVKASDKAKLSGVMLDKHTKASEAVREKTSLNSNPVYRQISEYRKQFKTREEFIQEARIIKDKSFKETDNKKRVYLINLYKALEKEADRLSNDKVHSLNEQTRSKYKSDAEYLRNQASAVTDPEKKRVLEAMADTIEQYSNDLPRATSRKEKISQVAYEIGQKIERGKSKELPDNGLEK